MIRSVIVCTLCISSFCVYSQEANEQNSGSVSDTNRVSKVKVTNSVELVIPNELFISGQIPADLPPNSNYNSSEIYFKVIQGYINTHTDLINPETAMQLGFTMPELIDVGDERKSGIRKQRIRKEEISEEEKKLMEKRSKDMHKQ